MSPELTALALAGLWQMVQVVVMVVPANRQLGVAYTAGPRDEKRAPTGLAGRLHRASENHYQALALFAAAVLVVELGGAASAVTAGCAWAYLAARVLYVPAYASGIPYLRSAIWFVGFGATGALFAAALL